MLESTASRMSMTGFSRIERETHDHRWAWELRSVNGKGLEVRFRLPPGFDDLEVQARARIGAALGRGNVQASLSLQVAAGAPKIKVNEPMLRDLLAIADRVGRENGLERPRLEGLLALRGVLELGDEELSGEVRASLLVALLAGLDEALVELKAVRAREGAALTSALLARLADIERLSEAAARSSARSPQTIAARLAEQIAALTGAAPALDPARLHQEAVLLATKADISEEIDRLNAHVAAARALLARGTPIGRQLDFLAQEFNRETNTLCSKSNDSALTAIGLELKLLVDQLREQALNLE